MLLSAIAAHLTPAAARRLSRKAGPRPAALAAAPVVPFVHLEPIGALELVDSRHYDVAVPAATHTEDLRVEVRPGATTVALFGVPADAQVSIYDVAAPVITEQDGYHAAIRHQLAAGEAYGPTVQRVVRYSERTTGTTRQVIMQGRLSDILRALPDDMSHALWREAGVMGLLAKGERRPIQMEVLAPCQ